MAVTAQASSVAEAGAAIQEASFDLTLMNVRSHDGGAVNLCRELRELTTLPLVVLTSFMTVEHWRALHEAGAAEYLLKHADSQLLCDAIIRLADRYQLKESG